MYLLYLQREVLILGARLEANFNILERVGALGHIISHFLMQQKRITFLLKNFTLNTVRFISESRANPLRGFLIYLERTAPLTV